jgi:hypothetical protein
MLEAKGEFRPSKLSNMEIVQYKALGPLLALWGKLSWLLNKTSGEEIYAVFTNGKSGTTE